MPTAAENRHEGEDAKQYEDDGMHHLAAPHSEEREHRGCRRPTSRVFASEIDSSEIMNLEASEKSRELSFRI